MSSVYIPPPPTAEQLAYVAGIIDGEGCIQLQQAKNGAGALPAVRVSMAEPAVIHSLRDTFAAGSVLPSALASGKIAFVWAVYGPTAVAVLEAVLPYLRGKRNQARLVLTVPQSPRGRGWRRIPDSEREYRKWVYIQLRAMKEGRV